MVTHLQIKWLYYDYTSPALRQQRWECVERKQSPYDDQTWRDFWDVVSRRMSGLQDLKASLDVTIYNDHLCLREWLEPLLAVHGLRRCAIELKDSAYDTWGKSEGPWERPQEVMCLERRLEDHMCGKATFDFAE